MTTQHEIAILTGEMPLPLDAKFVVPSLNTLMSLVQEVRQACKNLRKSELRQYLFEEELTKLNLKCETKLSNNSLTT